MLLALISFSSPSVCSAKRTTANVGLPLSAVAVEAAPPVIPNFEKVSTGIWRGAAPSEEALQTLKQDGVKTIVDLRLDGAGVDRESSEAKKLGLRYYHVPLGFSKPSSEKLRSILAIMTNPLNQPVFIHCRQGADRTGMLVGIYRRIWNGWSFHRTWEEMRQHHFKPFLFSLKKQVRLASSQGILQADAEPHDGIRSSAPLLVPAPAEPSSSARTDDAALLTHP